MFERQSIVESHAGGLSLSSDLTKSNHQDTKITKADQGRAALTGNLANLIADEVADPLPGVKPSQGLLGVLGALVVHLLSH
jgi:hypothetical protein